MFKCKFIVQFLEEKILILLCFCGLYVLCCYENGEECCIVCKLCEVVCFVLVIMIELEMCVDNMCCMMCYDIDLMKCIFCGFCEESCLVDLIVEMQIFEYYGEKCGDLYFMKDMLFVVGDCYEKDIVVVKVVDVLYC